MAQSIFIPKVGSSDLAALDYFTWDNAVYPDGTGCFATGRNKHGLVAFPKAGSNDVYFPGVMGQDFGGTLLTVDIFWVAPAIVGDVVWFVAWERDKQEPGGADIDVDTYAPEKSVVSAAPAVSGEIQRATIIFTSPQADDVAAGNPYRLRLRRQGSVLLDTMAGDAQFFRLSLEGVP